MKKRSLKKGVKKFYMLAIVIIMIAFGIVIYMVANSNETYLVKQEEFEYTSICKAFVLKEESIIDIDSQKVFIPIVSDGGRVAKNEIIAIYRGLEYDEYITKLEEMDKEIAESMKNIDVVYSTELQNLDMQILNVIKKSQGETSYTNMQECNNAVKKLFSKRAELVGEYSPDGAHVKEIIAQRNEYQDISKNSNDCIKATAPGLVTYTIDGLEDQMSMNKIDKINYEDLKSVINNKKESVSSIKVVNNYEAYIMIKVTGVDEEFINLGDKYTLRLVDSETNEFEGELVRKNNVEEGFELTFKITNGIEKLINVREAEMEVVWKKYNGLVIPNSAIKTNGKDNYVTILYAGKYIDVNIDIKKQNSKYSVVANEKGNKKQYRLEMYDQVLIRNK